MISALLGGRLEGMSHSAPSLAATPEDRTSLSQWVAVGVLSLATFIVVTSEMLPVGVLTPMADELGIATGTAGSSLTITGLVCAVTAPAVPRLLGNHDRRRVLAGAMVILAVGNILTAVASELGLLLVSRMILGIGMGTVWGMAAAVATRLVAPRNVALAVSFAVSGVAAASVLGVPLGTFIGDTFGWRVAFGSLSALALIAAFVLLVTLPTLRRPESDDTDHEPQLRRPVLRPAIITGLILVVLLVTAHFAAYTYVRPVLENQTGLAANEIALLLLLYGIFGMVGNFAAGATAGRRPRLIVLLLAAGITVAIAILAWFGASAVAVGIAIALWGIAYGGLSAGAQLWMIAAAPDRTEHITGLFAGVFTASIALGAAAGGIVIEGAGIVPMLWSTATLAFAALVVGLLRPGPRRSPARQVAGSKNR